MLPDYERLWKSREKCGDLGIIEKSIYWDIMKGWCWMSEFNDTYHQPLSLPCRFYPPKRWFYGHKIYKFLPQHFLNLRPLPQIQGSFRPIFGALRVTGVFGGQQLVLVHLGFSFISIASYPSGRIIIIPKCSLPSCLITIVTSPKHKGWFQKENPIANPATIALASPWWKSQCSCGDMVKFLYSNS